MDVRLPDGTIIRNVPEGTTRTQLTERLQRNGYDLSRLSSAAGGSQDEYQPYAEIPVSAAPEKPLGGFWSALFESAKTLGLADEAAAFAANPTEENRKALLAAGESKFRNVGFGEGENWAAFRQLLGGSLGMLVAPAAAATAASVATTPIGGIATGFGTSTAQYQAQNLLRQAQEQERAIAEGRTPQELELGKSVAASTAQAGLDVLQFGLFAKLLRAFPLVRNLVSSEKEIAEDAARKLVEAARQGTLKTTGRGVVQGVAGGVAFEVPQEIAQQALERWQAGLSLTDEEAREEFKQAAIGAAVLGPLMGGAAGGIRAKAEQAQAQDLRRASDAAQTRLEQIVAKPTPTPAEQAEAEFIRANADNPAELVKRYSTEALMAQGQAEQEQTTAQPPPPPEIETADALLNAPPKVSAEAAPEAMRAEPMRLTDEQVEEEIVKMEQQQEQLAALLFDPAEIQTQAAAANVPVEVYTANLTKAYDDLTTRVDIFNKNFMQRLRGEAPAAPTTSTPPPPAPADVDVATEDLVATEAAPVEAAPSATPSAPITPFAERPKQETMFSETAAPAETTTPAAPADVEVATEDLVATDAAPAPTPALDIRAQALEAIKTTPTIKAISEATGLNQPQAAAIMRGFVDEGIVERVGNKFRLVEAKKSEEATTPKEEVAPKEQAVPKEEVAPRVDSIAKFSFGPGVTIKPKVIAEGSPLYRETNADGLYDLLNQDRNFDVFGSFVTDDPDLAIGQGVNKGVMVEFRPNSISGYENVKPGTGVIGGKEYVADLIAPKAVQSVTFKTQNDFNKTRALVRRVLSREFAKTVNPDNSITFTRKPPTTPPEAPRGTAPEPVGETVAEPVGRGAELPVSRPAPEGREAAESGVGGLGTPSETAVRADERTEGVEPALEEQVTETPQALSQVEEKLIHDRLSETQKRVIAQEFEQDSYNDVAKKRFIEEVIKGVNEGIKAVRARLRGIVRAVMVAFLSIGTVFSNSAFTNLAPKAMFVASASTVRATEVSKPAPPAEAADAMSPAARATYERFMINNKGMPFIIADKPTAQVFLFKADGSLIKFFPALYGKTKGDVLSHPIGQKLTAEEINRTLDSEKITPAGEFTAVLRRGTDFPLQLNFQDAQGNVGAMAIHQVYTGNVKEQRLERLSSADITDNKVSYGCINVGLDNWNNFIVPNYAKGARVGVVPDETGALDKFIPPPDMTVRYTVSEAGESKVEPIEPGKVQGVSAPEVLGLPREPKRGDARLGMRRREEEKDGPVKAPQQQRRTVGEPEKADVKQAQKPPKKRGLPPSQDPIAAFGLFSKSKIVVSEDFSPAVEQFLKAIVGRIGLGNANILLLSKWDLHQESVAETAEKYGLYGDPYVAQLIETARDKNTFGGVIPFASTDGYAIVVDHELSAQSLLEALGHELGHIVEWEAYFRADKKTKDAIEKAYNRWLESVGQGGIGDTGRLITLTRAWGLAGLDLRLSEAQLSRENDIDTDIAIDSVVLDETRQEYLKSFSEWFADNVSKWMTTSEKPLGVVEQFFAGIAKRLRNLVAFLTKKRPEFLPDPVVKKFLDGLTPMNETMTAALMRESARARPTAVKESRRLITSAVNNVGNTVSNLPKMNKEIYDGVRSTLDSTRISDAMRRGLYAFLSLPQQVQLFAKELPTLQELLNVLNVRASALKDRKEVLDRNIRKWNDAIKEHAQYKDEFYEVAHESTRLQIEFNAQKFANHPLTQRFNRLPPALQKVYWEMLSSYRDMADEYLALISKNLSPREAVRLQREMAKKRLRVYLPLYREGDYWMRYQDANNDTVVQSFKSNYERELAWKEAVANGAKSSSKQNFTRVDEFFEGGGPGTFFNKVLEDLNKRNAPEAVKRSLYELYLDQIPASSVRQLYRKRDGYKGYESDLMNVYSTVATRMANQLINLEYIPEIDKVFNDVKEDAKKYAASGQSGNRAVPTLIDNLEGQMEYLRDPGNGSLVNALSSFSYYWYIIGNISTAVINTTQLPMVVYPMLAGKYGVDKATSAMSDATKQYFKGGFDNDNIPGGYKKFPADFSFGVGVPPNSPLGRLYKAAVRQSAIRRSTGYDLIQGRKKNYGMGDYIGLKAKMEQILGWTFQNSERFNREVTLIAAFNLEMQKNGGNVDAAIKTALDLVNDTHGTVLTETSPRVFQTGFGKVAFTFKNFAQTQIYLQAKLLREAVKGETPEVQRMAAKQMLGIMTMAFMFAGLHGMPFYSAATLLADILADIFGDDDDPLKSNEIIRQSLGSLVHKGPVNEVLMVDIASRTGFNSLLWRDDDKRLEEVGPILFAAEQIFGPTYAAFANMYRGYKDFKEGHIDRAIEATTPAVIRNGLKSVRFASEGAQSRSGEKIYDDFNTYELAMQAFGFTPVELARRSESAGALASRKSNLTQRKTALLDRLYLAKINGDKEGQREAMEAIRKFNSNEFVRKTRNVIGFDDIQESLKRRMKNARTSVYGINVPEKARRQLEEMYKLEEDR